MAIFTIFHFIGGKRSGIIALSSAAFVLSAARHSMLFGSLLAGGAVPV